MYSNQNARLFGMSELPWVSEAQKWRRPRVHGENTTPMIRERKGGGRADRLESTSLFSHCVDVVHVTLFRVDSQRSEIVS